MSTTQPAVLFGGPSPEHDVSVLTGLQAAQALAAAGRPPIALFWAKNGDWHEVPHTSEGRDFDGKLPDGARPVSLVGGAGFVAAAAKKGRFGRGGDDEPLPISAAVNCLHGGPGEDGSLQGALDLAGVRYSGPSQLAAALGMDKLAFGDVVRASGLPSLPRVALLDEPGWTPGFDGPYIVKPRFGGSSIGIQVVDDAATALALLRTSVHLRAGAVVEPYRPDSFDLNVAVRTFPSLQLSAIEKPVRGSGGAILGYADKYTGGQGMASAPRELPAALDPGLEEQLRAAASTVARLANVRGVARIDFLLDGDALFVNEINTIPGSLARYLWIDPAIPFGTLLTDMLDEAEQRPTFRPVTDGADGSALRAAGNIASKLG